jgi:hypothetical protein
MVPHALVGLAASFAASVVNAIAGGGTFIAFPAIAGGLAISEKLANATCTIGLWPGYVASVGTARGDLAKEGAHRIGIFAIISALGGAAGGALLLATPVGVFKLAIPLLLGIGTILFAAGPRISAAAGRSDSFDAPAVVVYPILFAVSVYNGYFGAGGGVLVIAALSACGVHEPWRANVLKTLVQMTSNAFALVVLLTGTVLWNVVPWMWAGALIGGWLGMRAAARMPRAWLRAVIIACGASLTLIYAYKALT